MSIAHGALMQQAADMLEKLSGFVDENHQPMSGKASRALLDARRLRESIIAAIAHPEESRRERLVRNILAGQIASHGMYSMHPERAARHACNLADAIILVMDGKKPIDRTERDLLEALRAGIAALESSKAIMAHYPEPRERHEKALAELRTLLIDLEMGAEP